MAIFFNDTATTEIYTLSLHDALPIFNAALMREAMSDDLRQQMRQRGQSLEGMQQAMEEMKRRGLKYTEFRPRYIDRKEHTSELQSRQYLVCRLLLEKKKTCSHTTIVA